MSYDLNIDSNEIYLLSAKILKTILALNVQFVNNVAERRDKTNYEITYLIAVNISILYFKNNFLIFLKRR